MNKRLLLSVMCIGCSMPVAIAVHCARKHMLKPGQTCEVILQGHVGYIWKYATDKSGLVTVKYIPHHQLAKKKKSRTSNRIFAIKGLKSGAVTITFSEKAKDPKKQAKAVKPQVFKIIVAHAPSSKKPAVHVKTPPVAHGKASAKKPVPASKPVVHKHATLPAPAKK